MRYIRLFQTGTGTDPRDKWIAEFKCDCGHIEWVNVPGPHNFNDEDRLCPKCKTFGSADKRKRLVAKHEQLLAQQARIRAEIEQVTSEIAEFVEAELAEAKTTTTRS